MGSSLTHLFCSQTGGLASQKPVSLTYDLPSVVANEQVRYLVFIFCLSAAQFQVGLFDIQQWDEDVTVAVESSNKLLQGKV